MIFPTRNRLTVENLQSLQSDNPPKNEILVSIKSSIRRPGIIGFEKIREHLHENHIFPLNAVEYNIYAVIAKSQDYRIASWDSKNFRKNLIVSMSEKGWITLKNEVVTICSKYNAKQAKLRQLIQYNFYRSFTRMFFDFLADSWVTLISQTGNGGDLITWKNIVGILLLFVALVCFFILNITNILTVVISVAMLVDLLLCCRFCIFRSCHSQFILNVLQNNVDLDPATSNEIFIMEMTDLAKQVSRRHPGVNCVFRVSTEHIHGNGSTASHDDEHFELSFLKNAPSDGEDF